MVWCDWVRWRAGMAGTMAAAHSITVNLWQLVGVILLALSNAATILIPQRLNRCAPPRSCYGQKWRALCTDPDIF